MVSPTHTITYTIIHSTHTYAHTHTHSIIHSYSHKHTHTQTRSKGANRRPPSRHALRARGSSSVSEEAISDKSIDAFSPPSRAAKSPKVVRKQTPKKDPLLFEDDFLTQSLPKATTRLGAGKSVIDDLEGEISEETGIFGSKKGTSKISVTLDNDLFGERKKENPKVLDDDLFSTTVVKPKPVKPQVDDDLFSSPPPKPHPKPETAVDIFGAPPEDIFASKQPEGISDLFSAAKEDKKDKGLDDLFGSISQKTKGKEEKRKSGGQESTDGLEKVCVCVCVCDVSIKHLTSRICAYTVN